MDRRIFLRLSSLLGIAGLAPNKEILASGKKDDSGQPFPKDYAVDY